MIGLMVSNLHSLFDKIMRVMQLDVVHLGCLNLALASDEVLLVILHAH